MNILEVKMFIESNDLWNSIIEDLAQVDIQVYTGVPLVSGDHEVHTIAESLRLIRQSLCTYYSILTFGDLNELETARNTICSLLAAFGSDLNAAPHYMLNHFHEDLNYMRPCVPRFWICEAEEAANAHHRRMSNATLKGALVGRSTLSLSEMMLLHMIQLHFLRQLVPRLE